VAGATAIIPARFQSTRLPGKPLALPGLDGKIRFTRGAATGDAARVGCLQAPQARAARRPAPSEGLAARPPARRKG
jgi:hypothetical protein